MNTDSGPKPSQIKAKQAKSKESKESKEFKRRAVKAF